MKSLKIEEKYRDINNPLSGEEFKREISPEAKLYCAVIERTIDDLEYFADRDLVIEYTKGCKGHKCRMKNQLVTIDKSTEATLEHIFSAVYYIFFSTPFEEYSLDKHLEFIFPDRNISELRNAVQKTCKKFICKNSALVKIYKKIKKNQEMV